MTSFQKSGNRLLQTWLGLLGALVSMVVTVSIADQEYHFTGEVLYAKVLQNKYIVAGLLTQIQVLEFGKVQPVEIELPRHSITGERLTLRSLEVCHSSGIIIAGLTKSSLVTLAVDGNGTLKILNTAFIKPDSQSPITSITTLESTSEFIATFEESLYKFKPDNLFSMNKLTKVETALLSVQLAQSAVNADNNLTLVIQSDRSAAVLLDYYTGRILKKFQAIWYSDSASLTIVDAMFPSLRAGVSIVSILLSDGLIVSYDYDKDLYFDKVRFNQGSKAINLLQIPDSDWIVVSYQSSIVVANIFNASNFTSVNFQRITKVFKYSDSNTFIIGPNGRIATLTTYDICPSGCLSCSHHLTGMGVKICKECKSTLNITGDSRRCESKCNVPPNLILSAKDGCVAACLESEYVLTEYCETCDPACKTCYGPNSNRCLSCKDAKRLTKEGRCESSCPSTQYYNSTTGVCDWCLDSCIECTDESTCKKCIDGYTLDTQTQKCVPICPSGTFLLPAPFLRCDSCKNGCTKCTGNTLGQCTECDTGYYLSEGYCQTVCPLGTYKNDSEHLCSSCGNSCVQCTDSEHCTKCEKGTYRLSMNDSCVKTCDPEKGLYLQDDTACHACKHPCKTCDQRGCLTCRSGYDLKMRECWKESEWKNHAFIVIGVILGMVGAVATMGVCYWRVYREQQNRLQKIPRRSQYELTEQQDNEHSRITDMSIQNKK